MLDLPSLQSQWGPWGPRTRALRELVSINLLIRGPRRCGLNNIRWFYTNELKQPSSLRWEITTNKVSGVQRALQQRSSWASFTELKNGRGGAMRQRPGAAGNHWYAAEWERERGRNKGVYTPSDSPSELQWYRGSGILTLAYSDNCYSFTLAASPRTFQTTCETSMFYFSACTLQKQLLRSTVVY